MRPHPFGYRIVPALIATFVALLVVAAPASAAFIDGSPLQIDDGENGSLFADLRGDPSLSGGLQVLVKGTAVYGSLGASFSAGSSTDQAGAGTVANPYFVTSTYTASPGGSPVLEVNQRTEYVEGAKSFTVEYTFKNVSASPLSIVPKLVAGIQSGGFGIGSPFTGAVNWSDQPGFVGIEPLTAPGPIAVQEADRDVLNGKAGNDADSGGDFANSSVDATFTDASVGMQSNTFNAPLVLGAGVTSSAMKARFHLSELLRVTANSTSELRGGTQSVTATVSDFDGAPRSGVRYKIEGANPRGVTTAAADAGGAATITWTGTNAGNDLLTVWDDRNGDSNADPAEPQRTQSFHWATPPVPPEPAPDLAAALNGQSGLVTGASWLIEPPGVHDSGPADKVWAGALGGFPTAGDSFALMSSGDAAGAAPGGGGSSNSQGNDARGASDVSILRVDLSVPADARCLAVNFKFLTDES